MEMTSIKKDELSISSVRRKPTIFEMVDGSSRRKKKLIKALKKPKSTDYKKDGCVVIGEDDTVQKRVQTLEKKNTLRPIKYENVNGTDVGVNRHKKDAGSGKFDVFLQTADVLETSNKVTVDEEADTAKEERGEKERSSGKKADCRKEAGAAKEAYCSEEAGLGKEGNSRKQAGSGKETSIGNEDDSGKETISETEVDHENETGSNRETSCNGKDCLSPQKTTKRENCMRLLYSLKHLTRRNSDVLNTLQIHLINRRNSEQLQTRYLDVKTHDLKSLDDVENELSKFASNLSKVSKEIQDIKNGVDEGIKGLNSLLNLGKRFRSNTI